LLDALEEEALVALAGQHGGARFASVNDQAAEAEGQTSLEFFALAVALKAIRLEDGPDVFFVGERAGCCTFFPGRTRSGDTEYRDQNQPGSLLHGGIPGPRAGQSGGSISGSYFIVVAADRHCKRKTGIGEPLSSISVYKASVEA